MTERNAESRKTWEYEARPGNEPGIEPSWTEAPGEEVSFDVPRD